MSERKRNCKFNCKWMQKRDYGLWLTPSAESDEKAHCNLCHADFSCAEGTYIYI